MSVLRTRAPRLAFELSWRRRRGEHLLFRAVDELVQPGNVALDIGANRGLFTSRFLRLVGRSGRVHAFEPNPVELRQLRRIRSSRLTVHPIALSDRAGEAVLRVPVLDGDDEPGMGSVEDTRGRLEAPATEYTVKIRALPDIVGSSRVDFIKCDVEGHEHNVLTGALPVLRRHMATIVVEIEQRHRATDIRTTFSLLEGIGYSGWGIFESGLRPLTEFDPERDQISVLREGGGGAGPDVPANYVHNFIFAAAGRDLSNIA